MFKQECLFAYITANLERANVGSQPFEAQQKTMTNLRSPLIPDLGWGSRVSSWALLLWKTPI